MVEQLKYDPTALHGYLIAHASDPIDSNCGKPRVSIARRKTTVTHQ